LLEFQEFCDYGGIEEKRSNVVVRSRRAHNRMARHPYPRRVRFQCPTARRMAIMAHLMSSLTPSSRSIGEMEFWTPRQFTQNYMDSTFEPGIGKPELPRSESWRSVCTTDVVYCREYGSPAGELNAIPWEKRIIESEQAQDSEAKHETGTFRTQPRRRHRLILVHPVAISEHS
jgi:hypothetical protein